ncbi:MAG: RNA methyltransferase [Pseudomonadota bacterium]
MSSAKPMEGKLERPGRIPGRIEDISSPANPRIKSLKGLALKKNRDRDGLFLAEGEKLVHDALDAGWQVATLILNRRDFSGDGDTSPETSKRLQTLASRVRARGGDVLTVPAKLLTTITRRDNAQAVVAALEPRLHDLVAVTAEDETLWLALDRVRDPGNLGTIIRTADALGAKGLVLVGDTTDPFSPETVRATMGSLFHVPLVRCGEAAFLAATETYRKAGGRLIGTHLEGSVDHRSVDYAAAPHILLMGNEQHGLTPKLAKACDGLIRIAMAGQADSLNLAVATGIALFEARRPFLT